MIRGLVADDHAVVRKGMVQILSALDMSAQLVLDEAGCGLDALKSIESATYDFVLLDIALPDMNGLEVLKQIHQSSPDTPVLMLSVYPEKQYAIRALQSGASGYLTKESAPGELLTAVRQVLSGRRYVSESVAEALTDRLQRGESESLHAALSDREYQVLCLFGQGKSATQIAEHLSLSVKTISTYRSRILMKLELETTGELIRYALRHGLV